MLCSTCLPHYSTEQAPAALEDTLQYLFFAFFSCRFLFLRSTREKLRSGLEEGPCWSFLLHTLHHTPQLDRIVPLAGLAVSGCHPLDSPQGASGPGRQALHGDLYPTNPACFLHTHTILAESKNWPQ